MGKRPSRYKKYQVEASVGSTPFVVPQGKQDFKNIDIILVPGRFFNMREYLMGVQRPS